MSLEADIARRLRTETPDIATLPTRQRRALIQVALMDAAGVRPDDRSLIDRVDDAVTRIIPRVKAVTQLTDADIARILGKARPTIQAYVDGRRREILDPRSCDALIRILTSVRSEIDRLIRELESARRRAA